MNESYIYYVLPAMIALGIIIIFPISFGIYMSFQSWNWSVGEVESMRYIGLENYRKLLHDPHFWQSIWHTMYFTIGALLVEFLLGLGCALLLNQDIKGKWFFRTAFIFPLMISDIVAALIWKMLLNPSLGPINYYIGILGLNAPNWFDNPKIVIPMAMIVDTWWQTGNITILLLAGLQMLPKSPLEMALVDGASYWQKLRYIILPLLRPVILISLLFRTLDLVRVFSIMWGITEGGPGRASMVAQLYIYRQGMGRYLKMGYSASLAIIFASVVTIVILIAIRRFRIRY